MEKQFKPGGCYFLLLYHDEDLRVPDIKTLIFLEKQASTTRGLLWCFVEPEEYFSISDHDRENHNWENKVLHRFKEDMLSCIKDWDELVEELASNLDAQRNGREFN